MSPAGGRYPLRLRRPVPWGRQAPTWRQARPGLIADALRHARALPDGGWYVVAASRDVRGDRPYGCRVAGRELVLWRDAAGRLLAGPGACPHLGAPLAEARVRCGRLVCHWHGLALDGGASAGWEPVAAYDDGLLAWVRPDAGGGAADGGARWPRPKVPARPDPARAVSAVYRGTEVCEPQDVVANRLDPWHGAWFHPYFFSDLTVVGAGSDGFTVDVSFRITRRLVVPVRAVFAAAGPRTVVMRITEGEGRGSVVETHATPLGADALGGPRTAVVEAVVAVSDRPGFALARSASALLRPAVRAAAGRLWRDDLAYARRRHQLRAEGRLPGDAPADDRA